jgi:hypothetical protein
MTSLHALLIGVDNYRLGRSNDLRLRYPDLRGSVRDIHQVCDFLLSRVGVRPEQLQLLTASNPVSATEDESPEQPEALPTYENMVAALQRLTHECAPGDQVYIHYSGHGGRAPTVVPDRKGPRGLDEALVPLDIHRPGSRYLRDVELAFIFQRMVERGLRLTVVLDSCHSGGAVRGARAADIGVRGVDFVDSTSRPNTSLVASSQELADNWPRVSGETTRGVLMGSSWLPEPRGYLVLAACTDSQSAYEFPFEGIERNGALTYCLLDTLRTYGTDLNAGMVYDRVLAKVHSKFEQQTPQLQGDAQRSLFGAVVLAPPASVVVVEVDASKQRVKLGAGRSVGVRKGAQLAVYPFGTSSFEDASVRQAIVTVEEVDAAVAWASITTSLTALPIEQGAPAVIVDPGDARLRRNVAFVRRADLPDSIGDQDASLGAVREAMATCAWLAEATSDDTLEYQVALNERAEYEIWDPAGQPINNLNPPLRVSAAAAPAVLVQRLTHLAKFNTVQQLTNHDPASELNGKLLVELLGVQQDYDPSDGPRPTPFSDTGHTPIVRHDWWTFLHIRNQSSRTLCVTVLDLQPDWGISQIWPEGAADLFREFEPGHEQIIPLRALLPASYTECRDHLKVFATLAPTDFHVLSLPALDQPATRKVAVRDATRGAPNVLEDLLASLVNDPPPGTPVMRTLLSASRPTGDWTTSAVEVLVVPSPA